MPSLPAVAHMSGSLVSFYEKLFFFSLQKVCFKMILLLSFKPIQ